MEKNGMASMEMSILVDRRRTCKHKVKFMFYRTMAHTLSMNVSKDTLVKSSARDTSMHE